MSRERIMLSVSFGDVQVGIGTRHSLSLWQDSKMWLRLNFMTCLTLEGGRMHGLSRWGLHLPKLRLRICQ
jgi:hypothetical protein